MLANAELIFIVLFVKAENILTVTLRSVLEISAQSEHKIYCKTYEARIHKCFGTTLS